MRDRNKVLSFSHNNRRREFQLELTGLGRMNFPYHRCEPEPSRGDPIVDAYIDDELGREGLTYVLASGAEGSVLADMVRDVNREPTYVRDMLLYRLSLEAEKHFDSSPMGIRAVARQLKTSPAQIYRLLDPTNYSKTVDAMLGLLQVLDAEVEVTVR